MKETCQVIRNFFLTALSIKVFGLKKYRD